MPTPKATLRFPLPAPLRGRMLKVLTKIDRDSDPVRHAPDLSSVVLALTEAGMDSYFLKAVRDAKLGFVARQTAEPRGLRRHPRHVADRPDRPRRRRRAAAAGGLEAHPGSHGLTITIRLEFAA